MEPLAVVEIACGDDMALAAQLLAAATAARERFGERLPSGQEKSAGHIPVARRAIGEVWRFGKYCTLRRFFEGGVLSALSDWGILYLDVGQRLPKCRNRFPFGICDTVYIRSKTLKNWLQRLADWMGDNNLMDPAAPVKSVK